MTILEITTNQSIAGKALIENGFKEVSSYFNDNIYSKDGENYKIAHPVWTKDLKAVRVEKRKIDISVNPRLVRMVNYIKSKGWIKEYIILNNIICSVGKSQEKSISLLNVINNYDSGPSKSYFEDNFKKFTTDKDGVYNGLLLFNVWDAFDAAILHTSNNES